MATPNPWFRRVPDATGTMRLFYFPFAGGNPLAFLSWQALLGPDLELRVAQLPGRGARLFDPPLRDLDELVTHLASAVADLADKRFAFFGHSLGALVAFEVARALRRDGLPGPDSLWVSGAEAPQTRLVKRRLHDLPEAELVDALRDYQGTPAELLDDREMVRLLLPGLRADFALDELYTYRAEAPLDVPIHLLLGDRDPHVEPARAAGWARESSQPLHQHVYAGDHFFIHSHQDAIATLLATVLAADRDESGAAPDARSAGPDKLGKTMNPYQSLPPRSFWRSAVAEPDMLAISELWTPKFAIGPDDPILTAGSCFASHIGRALLLHGMNWRDVELPPPGLTVAELRARRYGEFSFRTGTIYTAAMLRQWLAWAHGEAEPPAEVWSEGDRYFDPFRPAIEPEGYVSVDAVLAARQATLTAIRGAIAEASCLIFTLGLTEAWQDRIDGTVYPVCPGTVRGTFDAERHAFRNFTFHDVYGDLSTAIAIARAANPRLAVLLTVSPVPLTATATGNHALVATTYSKSVLRAVAGQLSQEHDYVDYFPSYEMITGFPFKGVFFEPNLRTVTPEGVAFVMRQFFDALAKRPAESGLTNPATNLATATATATATAAATAIDGDDLFCEDAVLDYYNAS